MKEYFYTITESMLDLGLRGTELNLFAIIFGYSQKGDGCCYASREELARRCGVSSKRTIDAALVSLSERGLIQKVFASVDGQIVVAFSASTGAKSAHPCKNCTPVQNLHKTGAKSAPKNKVKKKDIISLSNARTRETFVPPTVEEVDAYCRERGNDIDPQAFVSFYASKGWQVGSNPMKDWKQAVITWERRPERKAATPAAPSKPRQSKADEAFDNMMELGKELGL